VKSPHLRATHDLALAAQAPVPTPDLDAVQRRTLRVLFATQVISAVGVEMGFAVGALLVAELAGVGVSGLATSAAVVGGALLALPATDIVNRRGRRPSLAAGYLVAALGAIVIVIAARQGAFPLLLAGFFLFGGAAAPGLQARYAAVASRPRAARSAGSALSESLQPLAALVNDARFRVRPLLAGVPGAHATAKLMPLLRHDSVEILLYGHQFGVLAHRSSAVASALDGLTSTLPASTWQVGRR
jgi:hypothetical protein